MALDPKSGGLWLAENGDEELLFGRGFGIGTDIRTGPNGNLFVVSLTGGAVYEVFRPSPSGR
ncbi:MAG: hypothetical protein GWN84_22565 [Gammaproteobacteria bacterium]|nr:hypothetical protein [Gammaproteobacteria bacterium]NIR85416.1 hypothetical protein [Gammaproteobacteria bacterium]NIR89107.1 hypothetical protein [Gammaproteobacteria bacterium]NIU06552.1 hypothetical protein [Gammaproteobacteria bacterium]NIV53441.1 hypothetical protein [Gammaproteobacteria bacterium]